MKYLLKYSPEITIKSRPVRSRFIKQLVKNLTSLTKKVDEELKLNRSGHIFKSILHLIAELKRSLLNLY